MKDVFFLSKKKISIIVIAASLALVAVGCLFIPNMLDSKEKMVYECVLSFSRQFNDPSSVRIVSGTARVQRKNGVATGSLNLLLSANNSFGAVVTDPFIVLFGDDGTPNRFSEDSANESYIEHKDMYTTVDDFKVDVVNQMLRKYWNN